MRIKLEKPFDSEFIVAYKYYDTRLKRNYVKLYRKDGSQFSTYYARYLMSVKLGDFVSDDMEVDHKDNNKLNDDIDNLQLLSKIEHLRKSNQCFLTEAKVRQIKFLNRHTYLSQKEIAELYGTFQQNISRILYRKNWKNVTITSDPLMLKSLKCSFNRFSSRFRLTPKF